MSETPETCTHPFWEPCRLHPVDCPNCINGDRCRMRQDMEAHKNVIKRCRFYRPRGQLKL